MGTVVYKEQDGQLVKGVGFNLLLNHGDYSVVELKVYADGTLDCLGEISIDKLKDLLKAGRLTRTLPDNKSLFIPYIGHLWASNSTTPIYSDEKFIELIENAILELKSGDNFVSECISRFKEYLINPNDITLNKLKDTYSKLTENRKALFESDDKKDPLVALMRDGDILTREQREYYLKDYFDGEWLELK